MEILETLHDKPPMLPNFIPRKYKIGNSNTLITGLSRCGMTSIILDFLSTLDKKEYLYIDLNDQRLKYYNFGKLDEFIQKKSIKYLVVENITNNFKLPSVKNIILSSHVVNLKINGFKNLYINGLDFEEFIGFSQRNFNIEHIFKAFANSGSLPKSANLNEHENKMFLQESLRLCLNDEATLNLFCILAKNQANPYSMYQAYNELKLTTKISKDKLYDKAKELENIGLISFVEKFNSPKSPKKIYLNNFAYKNAITYEKDFIKRLENMVFCEFKYKKIYYTNELHFYLPELNQAILVIPFLLPDFIKRRFKKLLKILEKLHVKTLKVITLGNEGKDKQNNIECEILPFWEWALLLQ